MKKQMKSNSKKNSKKNKNKKHHPVRTVFLGLLVILIAFIIYFAIKVQANGGGLAGVLTTIVGSSKDEIENLEDLYILCMGKSQNLTDTIIVVKYVPKTQQASMLSIPRDSFVGNNIESATPYDKINARYSTSAQSTIDAVNKLTGLKLKYYITIDTKALRELVDTIGGVYFDVPIPMDYDDGAQDLYIHLAPGYQLLDGVQAEGVVRFRHNNDGTSYSEDYGDNDLGRMKTQREFIKTVISQTMKPSNITKINDLLGIAKQRLETNLSWDVIKNYIPALVNFNTENLRSDALPGKAGYYNNYSFFIVNQTEAKQVVNDLFLATPEEIENGAEGGNVVVNEIAEEVVPSKKPSEVTLELINGTGSTTKFQAAVTQLQNQGYKIATKGTTNVIKSTILIDRKSNSTETENALKSLLCTGTVEKGEDIRNVDFTIMLGQDY